MICQRQIQTGKVPTGLIEKGPHAYKALAVRIEIIQSDF
jgi:hypothetical protein